MVFETRGFQVGSKYRNDCVKTQAAIRPVTSALSAMAGFLGLSLVSGTVFATSLGVCFAQRQPHSPVLEVVLNEF